MPADEADEVFEIVDEDNRTIGTELRKVVHQTGLLHRSVYCFVFNPDGELLIQQRAARKDIGPLLWDLSLAEHLKPGEEYREAVRRGLDEELGIQVSESAVVGPLQPAHLRKLEIPGKIKDFEFVQSFRLNNWTGATHLDAAEVAQVRWVTIKAVRQAMQDNPEQFTPWFVAEIRHLDWFSASELPVLCGVR